MNNSDRQLIIRDYPTALWLFGLFMVGFSISAFFGPQVPRLVPLVGLGLAGLLFTLPSVLVITADKSTGFLTLEYRSWLRRSKKEIALHELEAIQVNQKVSHDSDGASTTYQIVAVTKDGMMTPFRSYSTGSWRSKQKTVEKLRAFTGVGGVDPGLRGMFKQVSQRAKSEFQKQQAELTGPPDEKHVTNGVRWQVQTTAFGGAPVTRWFSPNFKTDGGFLFLAQIVKGQKMPTSGLMASINSTMLKASMSVYGLGDNEAPGMTSATPLDLASVDARLAEHFSAYADDPSAAKQILNPWACRPLFAWAEARPLKQVQVGYGGQLVALFGPDGVFLGTLGTVTPQQLDELTALGVELIRAQGTPTA